jgi:hypothetical protein
MTSKQTINITQETSIIDDNSGHDVTQMESSMNIQQQGKEQTVESLDLLSPHSNREYSYTYAHKSSSETKSTYFSS